MPFSLSVYLLSPLFFAIGFFWSADVLGMDPFSAVSVGSSAMDAIQSIAGGSQEIAATADALSALSELSEEVDGDSSQDEDAAEINRRLKEVQEEAQQAGYTSDEIDEILRGSRESSEDLTSLLRRLTKSIRLGKRLAKLAGLSTQKAAQVSEIEQVQSRNEEKKILTSIYHQMVRRDLDAKHEELRKQKVVRREIGHLHQALGRLAPGGDLRFFPGQGAIVQKAIEVFRSYAGYILGLVALIFLCRLIYYHFSFAPPEKYTELIFSSLTCYFLMAAFPMLYGYLGSYSDGLAAQLAKALHVAGAAQPEPAHLFGKVLPWWLQPAVLQSVVYLLIYSVFNLILAVLVALGPIAILTGTMLHFTFSLTAYVAALILVWLWPVLWNVVGYFAGLLWQGREWSGSGIAQSLTALLFWLVQLLSPLLLFKQLQRTQVGQTLQGAVRFGVRGVVRAGSQKAVVQGAMAAGRAAKQAGRTFGGKMGASFGSKAPVTSELFREAGSKRKKPNRR